MAKEGKSSVTIFRREGRETRSIKADLEKIELGQEGPVLKPFDIVDVPTRKAETCSPACYRQGNSDELNPSGSAASSRRLKAFGSFELSKTLKFGSIHHIYRSRCEWTISFAEKQGKLSRRMAAFVVFGGRGRDRHPYLSRADRDSVCTGNDYARSLLLIVALADLENVGRENIRTLPKSDHWFCGCVAALQILVLLSLALTAVLPAFANSVSLAGDEGVSNLRWKPGSSGSRSRARSFARIRISNTIVTSPGRSDEVWTPGRMSQTSISNNSIQTSRVQAPLGPVGDGVSLITVAQTPENVLLFSKDPENAAATTRIFYNKRGMVTEADIVLNPFLHSPPTERSVHSIFKAR